MDKQGEACLNEGMLRALRSNDEEENVLEMEGVLGYAEAMKLLDRPSTVKPFGEDFEATLKEGVVTFGTWVNGFDYTLKGFDDCMFVISRLRDLCEQIELHANGVTQQEQDEYEQAKEEAARVFLQTKDPEQVEAYLRLLTNSPTEQARQRRIEERKVYKLAIDKQG